MEGQEDGPPFLRQSPTQPQDQRFVNWIELRRGFIQKDHRCLLDQDPGQKDPLALSPRKRRHRLFSLFCQSQEGKTILRHFPFPSIFLLIPGQMRIASHEDRFTGRIPKRKLPFLRKIGNLPAQHRPRQLFQSLPIQQDLASQRGLDPSQSLQQGTFPGSIGADQSDTSPRFQRKIKFLQNRVCPISHLSFYHAQFHFNILSAVALAPA